MTEDDSLFTFTEITKHDFDNLCRVCLQDGVLKSVFAEDEVPRLSQKINECASIQVQKDDGLPENICEYCITELNLAYYFKQQCQSADAKLRQIIKISDADIINNEVLSTENESINTTVVPETTCIQLKTINHDINAREKYSLRKTKPETGYKEEPINEFEFDLLDENLIPNKEQSNTDLSDCNDLRNTEENKYKHKCRDCNKSFIFLSRLRQHEAIHSNVRPFECKDCKLTFTRKDTLISHERTHLKLKPFKCDTCGANFTRRNSLNKHLYVHTKFKKYKCSLCLKSFGRQDNFRLHMKTHKGMKTHKCDQCTKSFIRSDVLMRHKKIHGNKERHTCNFCSKTYSRRDVLQAHLKHHRNGKKN